MKRVTLIEKLCLIRIVKTLRDTMRMKEVHPELEDDLESLQFDLELSLLMAARGDVEGLDRITNKLSEEFDIINEKLGEKK